MDFGVKLFGGFIESGPQYRCRGDWNTQVFGIIWLGEVGGRKKYFKGGRIISGGSLLRRPKSNLEDCRYYSPQKGDCEIFGFDVLTRAIAKLPTVPYFARLSLGPNGRPA